MREVFGMLARHKVIEASLVPPLEQATGFRNRLVHAYADITPEVTWKMLRESFPALVSFADAIARQR